MLERKNASHPMRRLLSHRRGLLAGAAALFGAGLAKLGTSERAIAGHDGGTPEDVAHTGILNTSAARTAFRTDAAGAALNGQNQSLGDISTGFRNGVEGFTTSNAPAAGVYGAAVASQGIGTVGYSSGGTGVVGTCIVDNPTSRKGVGVYGIGATLNGAGVAGIVPGDSANTGCGVVGLAAGCDFGMNSAVGVAGSGRLANSTAGTKTGVLGITGTGIAVEGWAANGGTGIRGSANFGGGPDFSGSGIGVQGRSGSGTGVDGRSTSGVGVQGTSVSSYGLAGASTTSFGLVGASSQAIGVYGRGGTVGIYGVPISPNGFAAQFNGNVVIQGSLTVTGSYPKSAAVKKRDGTQARMYCMESPESWFEDFGEATLANGRAVVQLDPEFDEVVKGDNYQVFLTEYAANQQLYVADRRPHRFEVRSNAGVQATGAFGYRVIARRLDNVGKRMEKVEIPPAPKLDESKFTVGAAPTSRTER